MEDNKNGQSICPPYNRKAFTLSEVLITLVIIGIISAITMPTLFANHKWQEYKSALEKAHSTLNNAVNAYYLENGAFPQCGYNLSVMGDSYTTQDCESLLKSFQKTMQVQKVCDTHAYANGCIPDYKGSEEVYVANNPDASDYDVQVETSSAGFTKSKIRNGSAIILNDGMIIFTNGQQNVKLIAVDVNSMKGPNKWGHDVHVLQLMFTDRNSTPQYYNSNFSLVDKGGKSVRTLLYGKD